MKLEEKIFENINCELNFNVGDLLKLSERICIQLTQLKPHSSLQVLTAEQIIKGVESRLCVRKYLRQMNVNNTKIKFDFNKIGGLFSVKQRLIEIFVWPIKVNFNFIFNNLHIFNNVYLI